MFSCMAGRRRSSQRLDSRTSSPGRSLDPGWKTGVSASFKTSIVRQMTSIAPVTSFGFVVPSGRAPTVPCTRSTHSARAARAAARVSAEASGPITTWVRPQRSRRSMKITPLWSRTLSTQPHSETSTPIRSGRNSPQVWVLSTEAFLCSSFVARKQIVGREWEPQIGYLATRGLAKTPSCRCRPSEPNSNSSCWPGSPSGESSRNSMLGWMS